MNDCRQIAELTSLSRLKFALWDNGKVMLGVSVHPQGLGAGKAPPERTRVPAEGTLLGHPPWRGGVSSSSVKRFERMISARSDLQTDGVTASQL